MSDNEKISYHIDSGGETEIAPIEYKIAILQYRFGYDEVELRKHEESYINELFTQKTEE